jgi:hypothetical protein
MENLKNTLLKKIESKTIEQKPRWQFIVYTLLGILLGLGILVLSMFFVQLLMLVIREYTLAHRIGTIGSSVEFLSDGGFWIVVILGIGLVAGLYHWLKNHTHLYRYKNLYLGIIILAIIIGSAIGIQLFDRQMQFARIGERPIPGIHQLNRAARPPIPGAIVSGKILMIQDAILALQSRDQKIYYVRIPSFEQLENDFETNDRITVFGIIHGDEIDARRIIEQ